MQARRLSKRIPREVARVSLGGGAGNMAGGAQDGRVNTLEALAGDEPQSCNLKMSVIPFSPALLV
jgi:hypothetical protein